MEKPWIVVAGSPVDGFEFYGPFAVREDAIAWAQKQLWELQSWWLDVLVLPATDNFTRDAS